MSTNRRFQFMSGTSFTPIANFWQLGTLTDVDPDIPNLPLEARLPFNIGQTSFVTTYGAAYPQSLRTWTQSPFIGNIPQPVAPPFFQTDWPLPKAPAYATSLRTHLVSLNNSTLAPVIVAAPFSQTDWPNPQAAPYHVQLRTWLQTPYIETIPPAVVQAPFYQTDWPNPQRATAPQQGQSTQSLIVSTLAVPVGKSAPFIQFRPLPKFDGQITQSLALATFAATPLRPNDWPLPKASPQGQGFEPRNLLGTTLAVAAAAPFKPVQWPNPVTALYPISLRTWTRNLLTSTLAPVAGVPFAFMGWTLPKIPARALSIPIPPFNLSLYGIVTPVVTVPDCGHLFPSITQGASLEPGAATTAALLASTSLTKALRGSITASKTIRNTITIAPSLKPTTDIC
jgi:hypothetical protein